MDKGYVQVYTGNGKGKTTAALGLSVRALCAGKKVFFAQFIKGMKCSELDAVHYFEGLQIKQYGRGRFVNRKPTDEEFSLAEQGLTECEKILASGEYDLVVLDEVNVALYHNLFPLARVLKMLDHKNQRTEVVLTGRFAPKELIDRADLVTEMREIKHYRTEGVTARKGIEK